MLPNEYDLNMNNEAENADPSADPEPNSDALTPGRRTTRTNTNSLPRSRKLRYKDDFVENSSEFEDEEKFHTLAEIQEQARVKIIYHLCLYKLETEDELRHEIQYVPLVQLKNEPMGHDSQGNSYYHFY
jgi:hypothetical protein